MRAYQPKEKDKWKYNLLYSQFQDAAGGKHMLSSQLLLLSKSAQIIKHDPHLVMYSSG